MQVNLGPVPNTTYDAWHYLVRKAKKTIDIAAFYVRLTDGSKYPPVAEGWQGAVSEFLSTTLQFNNDAFRK